MPLFDLISFLMTNLILPNFYNLRAHTHRDTPTNTVDFAQWCLSFKVGSAGYNTVLKGCQAQIERCFEKKIRKSPLFWWG